MSLALGGLGSIVVFMSVCLDCVVHEDDEGDGRYCKQDGNDDAEHDLYLSCYEMGAGIEIDRRVEGSDEVSGFLNSSCCGTNNGCNKQAACNSGKRS